VLRNTAGFFFVSSEQKKKKKKKVVVKTRRFLTALSQTSGNEARFRRLVALSLKVFFPY
jgi:hypothetical protein